ncbi:hypothetical protein DFH07DRAFT_1026703 [Mycena maculata]|uniref:Uncharacterized protein n=1 Tax=Mycena maculata TaxID=230809 RepID=A0AAD7K891_9AGAR|nr:hypothetical protein DFH07DRAFT_1026703 [Mycena maculata]
MAADNLRRRANPSRTALISTLLNVYQVLELLLRPFTRMFAHSPPEQNSLAEKGRARLIPARRALYALLCGTLGCSVGVGVATSWREWAPHTRECVAHFDIPRPALFLDEPRVVTVTAHAPAVSVVSGDTAAVQEPLLLNGPPTAAFKDNLREEVQYITTWPGSGWTNDVLLYMNLLYLGMITERVPVIPYFTPTHVGGDAPTLAFGQAFDIPRLQKALGTPILEWHQVKDPESEIVDTMGCWSVWKAVQSFNTEPHFTSATGRLKLDVSYTTAPTWISIAPENDVDPHATFWSLASLAFPETRAANLQTPVVSPIYGASLPPDEQMLCFDYLYYVGASSGYEWESDYGPAWRFVGRHMHWTPKILEITEGYVRDALVVAPYEPTPPYIGVHVRHGDFAGWCGDVPVKDCFAPLSVIARRVEEAQAELWATRRIIVDRVIVTSDERDPEWWDAVGELGWVWPDHSRTVELHGEWYPILIDAAIQSGGLGFVGTDRSTVSLMARKRVETWHGGAVRTVLWGSVNADDH